jgi:cbb3-type cytochrome oxidase maturation protein
MNVALIAQTIMTLLILLIFLGFLIWGIRSGQFRNIEDAKYRILKDNNADGEKDPEHQEGQ